VNLALHHLRTSALVFEALTVHDLIRGLELETAGAAPTLEANHASRISNVILLVDVNGQLAGGARGEEEVEYAAWGTFTQTGLLVDVTINTARAAVPLNAALGAAVGAGAAFEETRIPRRHMNIDVLTVMRKNEMREVELF
jgi:hypothetical protein